jgi:hypothetical protein
MKKFSIIILTLSVCFASGNHQSQLEKLMISLQEKYQVYTPDDLYKLKSRNPSVNHRNSTRDMSDIVGEWYVEEENAKMFITVGTDQIIPNIGQMMAMEEAQGSVQISAAAGSTTTFETELTYILDGSIMGDGDNDDSEISIGLIKDTDPWGGALNEQVLQEFDMEYDLIDRWMLMDLNLSYYDLIIVASDQPQELYDVFDSRLSDLEAFVTSGGTLQFNGADQGWNGSFWYELPGGVTHVNSGSYYNYVVDSNHPITEGIPSEIYANTASHCFLQDYPANTHFIMNDESGEYTLIEYELGDGLVLTTGITLDSPNNDNIFFQILTNMIDYSINQSVGDSDSSETDSTMYGMVMNFNLMEFLFIMFGFPPPGIDYPVLISFGTSTEDHQPDIVTGMYISPDGPVGYVANSADVVASVSIDTNSYMVTFDNLVLTDSTGSSTMNLSGAIGPEMIDLFAGVETEIPIPMELNDDEFNETYMIFENDSSGLEINIESDYYYYETTEDTVFYEWYATDDSLFIFYESDDYYYYYSDDEDTVNAAYEIINDTLFASQFVYPCEEEGFDSFEECLENIDFPFLGDLENIQQFRAYSERVMAPVDLVSIKPTDESLPGAIKLHAAYPNPFNPITTLRYDLPENSLVNITIYDMLGRQVKTLINQTQDAGFKSVIWDATNDFGKPVSAGVYLYKIQAGEFVQTKKMVLLK